MARIKMGLRSEAPIAPKLHKRPRHRRAEPARIEWVESGSRLQGEGDIKPPYISPQEEGCANLILVDNMKPFLLCTVGDNPKARRPAGQSFSPTSLFALTVLYPKTVL